MVDILLDGKRINGVDLAIFDKDGTLIELYHYWAQMIALRASLICSRLGLPKVHERGLSEAMGVDPARRKLKPRGPVGIMKREVVRQAAVDYLTSLGLPDTTDLCTGVFDEADALSARDPGRFIRPIPGARELLEALSARGCRIAIATTDRTGRAALAMQFIGFDRMIDLIVGADRVKETKPAPEMVELILRELGIGRGKAMMVGDAITDVEMGLKANLLASVAVLSGQTPAMDFMGITPYIIDDVSRIVPVR